MKSKEIRKKLSLPQKTILFAPGRFNEHEGKTARGILKYSSLFEATTVIDPGLKDKTTGDILTDLPEQKDIPIFGSIKEALEEVEASSLIIGVSPPGGELPQKWIKEIKQAIRSGYDIISGLHTYLKNNQELKELADKKNSHLIEVREPPVIDELSVADGKTDEIDTKVVLCSGTDCATGKMTTTYQLYKKAKEMELDAAWVATGQTGVLCGAQKGIVVDRVASDFVAGAVEDMVFELRDKDIVFVEGQGALYHRAYSAVTLGILHGSNPDAVVLAHDPSRNKRPHFPSFEAPNLKKEIKAIEELGDTEVVAINTWKKSQETREKTGLLTRNLEKDGVDELLAEVLDYLK